MFQRIRINGYFRQLGSPEIFLREFFFNNPTLERKKRNNRHVKFEATEKRSLVSRNHTILEELETKGSTIHGGNFSGIYGPVPASQRIKSFQLKWRLKSKWKLPLFQVSKKEKRESTVTIGSAVRRRREGFSTRWELLEWEAQKRSGQKKDRKGSLTCGKLQWRQEELWVHHPLTGSLCL